MESTRYKCFAGQVKDIYVAIVVKWGIELQRL